MAERVGRLEQVLMRRICRQCRQEFEFEYGRGRPRERCYGCQPEGTRMVGRKPVGDSPAAA
jgi:hypothetical protein